MLDRGREMGVLSPDMICRLEGMYWSPVAPQVRTTDMQYVRPHSPMRNVQYPWARPILIQPWVDEDAPTSIAVPDALPTLQQLNSLESPRRALSEISIEIVRCMIRGEQRSDPLIMLICFLRDQGRNPIDWPISQDQKQGHRTRTSLNRIAHRLHLRHRRRRKEFRMAETAAPIQQIPVPQHDVSSGVSA